MMKLLPLAFLLLAWAPTNVQAQGSVNYCDVFVEQCLEVVVSTSNYCSGDTVTYCLQDKSTTGCMLDGSSLCECKSEGTTGYSHINIYVDGVDLTAGDLSDTGFADTCAAGTAKGCGLANGLGVKYEPSTGNGLCVTVPLAADLSHPNIVFGVKDRGSCGIALTQGTWACSGDCHCGGNHACVYETGTTCGDLPTDTPMGSCRDYGGITDPFCYAITCSYTGGVDSVPASITFTKIDGDSCLCKDWSYIGWGRGDDEKVEQGLNTNTAIAVPSGASGNTFEVKSATTCFDVTCSPTDGSTTISSKSDCEYSGSGSSGGGDGGDDNCFTGVSKAWNGLRNTFPFCSCNRRLFIYDEGS